MSPQAELRVVNYSNSHFVPAALYLAFSIVFYEGLLTFTFSLLADLQMRNKAAEVETLVK